jgi:lysophospholipase L1-like esterase
MKNSKQQTANSKQQTANSKQQTANSKQWYALLITTNIISIVLLVIVLFHYDVPRKIILKFSQNYHDFYTHYEIRNRLFSVYKGKHYSIVMLGDSITEGAAWNELLGIADIANRGIGGDTTEGILKRLPDIYGLNPEMCFIMIGINDIGKGISVETITQNIEKIITGLESNGIKVIVQSTLFVAKNGNFTLNWDKMNKKVEQLNMWLEKYCDNKKIVFVDINKTLVIGNTLNTEYTYDGTHLLGNGYKKWAELIEPIIWKKQNESRTDTR